MARRGLLLLRCGGAPWRRMWPRAAGGLAEITLRSGSCDGTKAIASRGYEKSVGTKELPAHGHLRQHEATQWFVRLR